MADWTSQSRSSNPGKSQTKSLDKDQRYEVPSFLRAVPISRFPESRWDVHQPNSWYVHPSFTIRSSSTPCSPVSFSVPEKKKTHPRNKSKARNIPPDDVHPEDAPRVTCWPSCFALASSSRERTWRCFVTSAGGAAHGARGVMLESLDPPCLRILRWENLW